MNPLTRFKLEWAVPKPSPDGYWTPWREAEVRIEELTSALAVVEAERDYFRFCAFDSLKRIDELLAELDERRDM